MHNLTHINLEDRLQPASAADSNQALEKVLQTPAPRAALGPIFRPADIDAFALRNAPNTPTSRSLESALYYLRGFVCQPHPHLGREGPVCPFTVASIAKDLLRLSPFLGQPTSESIFSVMRDLAASFEVLAQIGEDDKKFVTLLLVFPEMQESEYALIDQVQVKLKHEQVKNGLMVGQFHYLCQEGGVCNPDFRPLRSPIPMLVLRHMTPGDIVFLISHPDFLQAFCQRFERSQVPSFMLKSFDEALEKFGLST